MGKEAKLGLGVIAGLLVILGIALAMRLGDSQGDSVASAEDAKTKAKATSPRKPATKQFERNESPANSGKAIVVQANAAGRAPQGSSSSDLDQWAVVSDGAGARQDTGYSSTGSSRPTFMPRLTTASAADRYAQPAGTQPAGREAWSRSQSGGSSSFPAGQAYNQSNSQTAQNESGTYQHDPERLSQSPSTYAQDDRINLPLGSNVYETGDPRGPSDEQSIPGEIPYSSSRPVQSARDGTPRPGSSGHGSDTRYSYQSPPEVPKSPKDSGASDSSFARVNSLRQLDAGSLYNSQGGTYTVQPNDSYWTISIRAYGTGACFKALAEHNRKQYPDPDRLRVGDVISVPTQSELERSYPQFCPKPVHSEIARRRASAAGMTGGISSDRMYVVEAGDTLYDIARFELGKASRWDEIVYLNANILDKDLDYLIPGMKLILPEDKSSDTVTQRVDSAYPR